MSLLKINLFLKCVVDRHGFCTCRIQIKCDKVSKRTEWQDTERQKFCPSPTEEKIYECRRHEQELKNLEKNNKHTAEWSDLRTEVKNWITDHRNNRICVSKNILFLGQKMGGCTSHHWFSWGILSVLQIYEQIWTTKQETILRSFMKCEISNDQNVVADDAVLEKSDSLGNNDSKNECYSTNEDFRVFYDQEKYHTTLPFCWVHSGESVLQVCTKYSPLNVSLKS